MNIPNAPIVNNVLLDQDLPISTKPLPKRIQPVIISFDSAVSKLTITLPTLSGIISCDNK
ncbi:hypothetical protein PHOSAC3_150009 [Mesotoga infera]|nr:hypothetical protein PHOSAC3_150009 [Mesotoga infera]